MQKEDNKIKTPRVLYVHWGLIVEHFRKLHRFKNCILNFLLLLDVNYPLRRELGYISMAFLLKLQWRCFLFIIFILISNKGKVKMSILSERKFKINSIKIQFSSYSPRKHLHNLLLFHQHLADVRATSYTSVRRMLWEFYDSLYRPTSASRFKDFHSHACHWLGPKYMN